MIKSWYANTVPDQYGNFVSIVGREEGLLSYLLAAIGIDATTRFRVDARNVYIEQGSLAGFEERVIPLSKVSSSYFGYNKPWREAILLGVLFTSVFFIGLILGPLYYFLNKKLTVGVVEVGSVVSGIAFKRSVIEGQEINENEARRVVGILRELILQGPSAMVGGYRQHTEALVGPQQAPPVYPQYQQQQQYPPSAGPR
ncbi:MAG: hypothetical protein U0324_30575 [Polyangiales bacterium]